MCRLFRHRWLPALAIFAALAPGVSVGFSQALPEPEPRIPTEIPTENSTQTLDLAAPASAPAIEDQPVAVVPQPPPTPEELGDSLMTHQRYQAAIEAYKKAPSNSADVWNKMGIAYQLMFNREEASHCYQTSLRLEPRNARVMNNLGTIYDSLKEYGNAERMYRKALKFDPKSALIRKNLGTNLLSQRKYKKGWEEYQTALELDPNVFRGNSSPRVQNPATSEERGAMNYYMAKGCVRAGMSDCAIDYLRMALNEGFTSPKKIEADSEFAGLRGVPAFQQLLAEQRRQ
jgi:tetratricopeptide (TPR) repeat protein